MVQGVENPDVVGCNLYISGNPSKFLQGHNLFGVADLPYLVGAVMDRISDQLGLPVTEQDRFSWYYGLFEVSRVDVTRMHDLGAVETVKQFLSAARQVAHSRYQPAGNDHGSTLYIGKGSRRAMLKLYDKLEEVQSKGHGLADTLPRAHYQQLMKFAAGKLRVEAQLRSMWLKDRNLHWGIGWQPNVAEKVLQSRIGGLELNDTMNLPEKYEGDIPGRLALVYEAWKNGRDLRSMYSKPHFYRLRAQLLKYGVDISEVQPRESCPEGRYLSGLGAPLKSFIEGPGVPIPEWAKGTPLLVEVPDWYKKLPSLREVIARMGAGDY